MDVLLIIVIFFKVFTVPAWVMLGIWFALQIFNGAMTSAASSGVAHWAHAGGFIAGVLLTLPLWQRRGGALFWQKTHGKPPHPDAVYSRSTVPMVRRRK